MDAKKEEQAPGASGCPIEWHDGEPVFVLRASDPIAVFILRTWAQISEQEGLNTSKLPEAHICASKMEKWRLAHNLAVLAMLPSAQVTLSLTCVDDGMEFAVVRMPRSELRSFQGLLLDRDVTATEVHVQDFKTARECLEQLIDAPEDD